jgi:hypothetical protein
LVPDDGAAALSRVVQRVENRLVTLREQDTSLDITLAGLTVVSTRTSLGMIGDLRRSLGVAVVVICSLLAVAFGSLGSGSSAWC